MCMISVVQDYGRTRVDINRWTPDAWQQFQELLRKIEELDAKLGEPDCVDPAKAAWMREVEARLKKLENPAATSTPKEA